MPHSHLTRSSRLLAYLQLLRLPNVFTAMADIAMGFWITHSSFGPLGVLALLLLASSCLYTAGMVLNDVYDVELDRRERLGRPLPSGAIPYEGAWRLGWSLLAAGILWGWLAAGLACRLAPGILATALAAAVVMYDRLGATKRVGPIGPLLMGGCRALNVLLGMSAAEPVREIQPLVAVGFGIYIAGITWFSRSEATTSKRLHLAGALATMLGGMAMLWWSPRMMPQEMLLPLLQSRPQNWALLWALLAWIIGWRAFRAILRPQSAYVQAAVKTGILSIIVLDAVIVFGVRGPLAAVAVLMLLLPTILLGRWIYST
ncbi:MAG: UbiA family prenyltransferase [Pirellulales bacterium]|nr:UbiA family prenyltransferase [Pirellulales bacterium]